MAFRVLIAGSRSFAVDPVWRTSDGVALARGIYNSRSFDRTRFKMRA